MSALTFVAVDLKKSDAEASVDSAVASACGCILLRTKYEIATAKSVNEPIVFFAIARLRTSVIPQNVSNTKQTC